VAAEQIAALINSSPRSPRVDELEAIVAGVMTRQHTPIHAMMSAPAVLEWHRQLADGDRKWMAPDANLSEEEWETLLGDEVRRSRAAFAKPVTSWEDVALLGAICMYWNFPHHDEDDQAELQRLLAQSDNIGMDQQSLAHLLRAICTMGGFAPGEIPAETPPAQTAACKEAQP
jgi:hypothetical protein